MSRIWGYFNDSGFSEPGGVPFREFSLRSGMMFRKEPDFEVPWPDHGNKANITKLYIRSGDPGQETTKPLDMLQPSQYIYRDI